MVLPNPPAHPLHRPDLSPATAAAAASFDAASPLREVRRDVVRRLTEAGFVNAALEGRWLVEQVAGPSADMSAPLAPEDAAEKQPIELMTAMRLIAHDAPEAPAAQGGYAQAMEVVAGVGGHKVSFMGAGVL